MLKLQNFGINIIATIQNIIVNGNPSNTKSLNLYCPGAKTIIFVWYPMGVIKLAEAPKQIAIKNGSWLTPILTDNAIAIGGSTTATAAFDKNDEITIDRK